MTDARYYVVGDHDVWVIISASKQAALFAIDAAKKLGKPGECAHACALDDDGHFRSK